MRSCIWMRRARAASRRRLRQARFRASPGRSRTPSTRRACPPPPIRASARGASRRRMPRSCMRCAVPARCFSASFPPGNTGLARAPSISTCRRRRRAIPGMRADSRAGPRPVRVSRLRRGWRCSPSGPTRQVRCACPRPRRGAAASWRRRACCRWPVRCPTPSRWTAPARSPGRRRTLPLSSMRCTDRRCGRLARPVCMGCGSACCAILAPASPCRMRRWPRRWKTAFPVCPASARGSRTRRCHGPLRRAWMRRG